MTHHDRKPDVLGPTLGGSIRFENRDDGSVEVTVIGSTGPEHALGVAHEAATGQAMVGEWKKAADGAVAYVETGDGFRFLFEPSGDSDRM